jgi:atypical dual specificity phosphatase
MEFTFDTSLESIDEIGKYNIYIGNIYSAFTAVSNKITHVINCLDKSLEVYPDKIKYLTLNVLDENDFSLYPYFEKTVKFIHKARKENENNKILVHCYAGKSRSVAIALAYFLSIKPKWSLNKTLNYIQTYRNCAKPNSGFMFQLEVYSSGIKTLYSLKK